MKEMKLLQLIFRTCRAPFFKGSPRFITCRPMNTSVDLTLDDTEMDASEHIKKQLLQAGLHYLKTDIERLKENVVNRAAEANVDELVGRTLASNILLLLYTLTGPHSYLLNT